MSRKSRQKDSVLRVVKGTDSHPTALWIYDQVRKEIPNVSLGTVYRNLRLLKQEGKISELAQGGVLSQFDGRIANHYHFRCKNCGRVFDVEEPVHKELDQRLAAETGFKVSYHTLEFRGLCPNCQ